jgi:RND superfamily putative drug exporter
MGFGIAVALALDATLVRLVLIPAVMRLLGERNWYLPRWLQWIPGIQVEGSQEPDVPKKGPPPPDRPKPAPTPEPVA